MYIKEIILKLQSANDQCKLNLLRLEGNLNRVITTGTSSGAGTAYPSGAPEFTPGFYSIFSFMCMFCRSLFVLLSFFFLPSCCLSFDLRILITHLVSSNSSCANILCLGVFEIPKYLALAVQTDRQRVQGICQDST